MCFSDSSPTSAMASSSRVQGFLLPMVQHPTAHTRFLYLLPVGVCWGCFCVTGNAVRSKRGSMCFQLGFDGYVPGGGLRGYTAVLVSVFNLPRSFHVAFQNGYAHFE